MDGDSATDKSVNAHNCRKSCTMSKLFLLHKMIAIANCDIGLNVEIRNLFLKYSKPYIELTSVVSDLSLYVVYLSQEQRDAILASLKTFIEDRKTAPAVR
jgi:hypothetical protein